MSAVSVVRAGIDHNGPLADAAAVALMQVAAARDDPEARLALTRATYDTPDAGAPPHRRFKRAAMSFMQWEVNRGVLNPERGSPPGSRWWRGLNERLLRDGCEAVARSRGLSGEMSSPTIEPWMAFLARPAGRSWYRAHNSSIVAAYLDLRPLAELESRPERFFLNVVLLRVLYAHALVAAPRLALGRLARLGRVLGDPRLGMAGAFLSMGRVLPRRYPLSDDVSLYLRDEHSLGRILDYAVISPRLESLYGWAAAELEQPALRDLVADGAPAYAWERTEQRIWDPPPLPIYASVLRIMVQPRHPF
jgi:hypothetical protein